jgi:hypothetical protein
LIRATLGSVVVFFFALALLPMPAAAQSATGCAALTSIPFREYVDYAASIQPIFDNACIRCHGNGSTFLDLSSGQSAAALIGIPSVLQPTLIRVVPGLPMQSLLRGKVQCAVPEVGARMPLNTNPLSLLQQALIYDWIVAGAPLDSGQRIFVGGFESRP